MPPRVTSSTADHQYAILKTKDDNNFDEDEDVQNVSSARQPYELDKLSDEVSEVATSKLLEPSELDLKTLRRVSGDIPWQAYSIAFIELCERFSWYGTTAVCEWNNDGCL